jgi:hypothetical protein
MGDSLATYLQDHLAGSVQAIELLEMIRDRNSGKPLAQFATDLLVEIKEDREALLGVARRVGSGASSMKEMAAWAGEKLARLKMPQGKTAFGVFEALEYLEVGIHGKWAMWRVLAALAQTDTRLQGTDFDRLAGRAENQHARIDEVRLGLAHDALRPAA